MQYHSWPGLDPMSFAPKPFPPPGKTPPWTDLRARPSHSRHMADAPPSREHGWSPVSRSLDKLLAERRRIAAARPLKVQDLTLPDSELVRAVYRYAQEKLPGPTFSHSTRVFYYGIVSPTPNRIGKAERG